MARPMVGCCWLVVAMASVAIGRSVDSHGAMLLVGCCLVLLLLLFVVVVVLIVSRSVHEPAMARVGEWVPTPM